MAAAAAVAVVAAAAGEEAILTRAMMTMTTVVDTAAEAVGEVAGTLTIPVNRKLHKQPPFACGCWGQVAEITSNHIITATPDRMLAIFQKREQVVTAQPGS